MATFTSKYNLGDSVWTVTNLGNWKNPKYHVWECTINEIQFTDCPCGKVRYLADDWDEAAREADLIPTLEEALEKELPKDAEYYILHRKGKHYDRGVKVEINRS